MKMNKIIRQDEVINLTGNSSFTVSDYVSIKLYIFGDFNVEFVLGKHSQVEVYHYNIDSDVDVSIYLRGEYASINYHYSIISKNNHKIKVDVFHEADHTISNIYNNAINVLNNKLILNVTGKVFKDVNDYICNQNNQIINMRDGHSVICPNLLIDSFNGNSDHSAYIGKFDQDKLFYLMSRGISLEMSIHILLISFLVNDDVDRDLIGDFLLELDKV
ncbi:MAG: SufD family Fe-S cluster assembly protein [Bacilli bacterium]|nr:SufD family Fe-S cluster assembly protein [Bacilli bacterium]